MTEVTQSVRYRRSAGVMWRDTGRHVLVLAEDSATDVKVIGGGAATLWRLLEQPRTSAELLAELEALVPAPPSLADLESCALDLVAEGLLGTSVEP